MESAGRDSVDEREMRILVDEFRRLRARYDSLKVDHTELLWNDDVMMAAGVSELIPPAQDESEEPCGVVYCANEPILRGPFYTVHEGRRRDGSMVALQRVSKAMIKTLTALRVLAQEIKALKDLTMRGGHENVVAFFGAFTTRDDLFVTLEHPPNAVSLRQLLRKTDEARVLESDLARRVLVGVSKAVAFIHGADITHRGLSPESVLVCRKLDDGGRIVVRDLSQCAPMAADGGPSHFTETCGFTGYFAPEIVLGEGYDERVDVWSIGCVVLECLVGVSTFHDQWTSIYAQETGRSTRLDGPQADRYCARLGAAVLDLERAAAGGAAEPPNNGGGGGGGGPTKNVFQVAAHSRRCATIVAHCLKVDPRRRPEPGDLATAVTASPEEFAKVETQWREALLRLPQPPAVRRSSSNARAGPNNNNNNNNNNRTTNASGRSTPRRGRKKPPPGAADDGVATSNAEDDDDDDDEENDSPTTRKKEGSQAGAACSSSSQNEANAPGGASSRGGDVATRLPPVNTTAAGQPAATGEWANAVKVLIVDDSPTQLFTLTRTVQREFACEVHTASSAMDAFNLIERLNFSVVITDMVMPFMDGFEFVTALRKRNAENTNERFFICAVTTLDIDDNSELYNQVDVVASKPFNVRVLKDKRCPLAAHQKNKPPAKPAKKSAQPAADAALEANPGTNSTHHPHPKVADQEVPRQQPALMHDDPAHAASSAPPS